MRGMGTEGTGRTKVQSRELRVMHSRNSKEATGQGYGDPGRRQEPDFHPQPRAQSSGGFQPLGDIGKASRSVLCGSRGQRWALGKQLLRGGFHLTTRPDFWTDRAI